MCYLNHNTDDALNAHDEYAFGTLFGRVACTVADRVLRFNTEQKAGRESVDVRHARLPVRIFLLVCEKSKIKKLII